MFGVIDLFVGSLAPATTELRFLDVHSGRWTSWYEFSNISG